MIVRLPTLSKNRREVLWGVMANRYILKTTAAFVALCFSLYLVYLKTTPLVVAESLRELHLKNVHWAQVVSNLSGASVLQSGEGAETNAQEFSRRMQLIIHETLLGITEHPEATLLHLNIDTPVSLDRVEQATARNDLGVHVTRVHLALELPDLFGLKALIETFSAAVFPWPSEARSCTYRNRSAGIGHSTADFYLECVLDIYHTAVPIEFDDWTNSSFEFSQTEKRHPALFPSDTAAQDEQAVPFVEKSPLPKTPGKRVVTPDYRVSGVVLGRQSQVFINDVPARVHPDIQSVVWMEEQNFVRVTFNSGEVLDVALD